MSAPNLPLDEAALSGPFADLNPISLVDQARKAIALRARVAELEAELHREHAARIQYEHELSEENCGTVADLVADRDEAIRERDALAAHVDDLTKALEASREFVGNVREDWPCDCGGGKSQHADGVGACRGTGTPTGCQCKAFVEREDSRAARLRDAVLALTPAASLAERDACVRAEEREALLGGDAVEVLAAIEHERWSGWMRYQAIAAPEKRADWPRKTALDYSQLTDEEQESDRIEARKTLAAIRARGSREGGASGD